MAPPTHPTGSLAYNSCGWHDGSCYAHVDGPWMDWGHNNYSTIDYYVRFRGWFYRSNTSYSNGYVMLNVFQVYSGTDGCDSRLRSHRDSAMARPIWYALSPTYKAAKSLYVSAADRDLEFTAVGYMVNDELNCSWTAAHTHESVAPVALTYYAENRTVYACCQGNGNKQNNLESNKTHTVQFQQGH